MSTKKPLLQSEHQNSLRSSQVASLLYEEKALKIYYTTYQVRLQVTSNELLLFHKHESSEGSRQPLLSYAHENLIGTSWKLLQRKHASNKNSNTVYEFTLHYYPPKQSWWGNCSCSSEEPDRKRFHQKLRLYFYNCEEIRLDQLNALFSRVIYQELPSYDTGNSAGLLNHPQLFTSIAQRSYLVFVNPANVKIELIVTKHAFHAKEYMANPDNALSQYHCILTVGGDGILYEAINGILLRPDGEALAKRIPIVPIPGGTGNGLSKSILFTIHEDPSPINATFNVIKGKPYPMDLSQVTTLKDNKTHYSFLMLSWGLISDIDIHSETLRFLGEMRLYLYAVYFILQRRMYQGRLRLKLVNPPPLNDPKITSKVSINKLVPTDVVQEDNWVLIEGKFVLCCILQATHLTSSMHFGPGIKLNDGVFTVYVSLNTSRLSMINVLLSGDSGGHIYSRSVRVFQCTEYELEPLTDNGVYSLDGEVVEYGPIRGQVLPGASRVQLIQK